MIKAGFSKIDLEKALLPDLPIRQERIEAVSFYAESQDVSCLWVVLDFMDFNRLVTDTLRKAVASETKMSEENIHIVTTHNHGGGEPSLDILAQLVAKGALAAKQSAVPSLMRYVFASVDKQVNILRRIWIPEIEGVGTLFYGASEKNDFDSAPFVENLIEKLKQGKQCYSMGAETQRPYAPFPSGDEELVAVQFQDYEGRTVGSIVRFAAHAVCCNRDGSFSSDYPFHVRRKMEENLGGISMFLNGPCGDIAPGMTDKYDGTEVVLGEYLAETATRALDKIPFEEVEVLKDTKLDVHLPVCKAVMDGRVELPREMPDDLAERRKYLDKKSISGIMSFLREKYTFGEKELSDKITVSLGFLRLGDLVFAGFPGETFWVTGRALQESFPGVDICTTTEHERTVMYLPPYEDSLKGSYESVCRTTDHSAESTLRRGAVDGMREFLQMQMP